MRSHRKPIIQKRLRPEVVQLKHKIFSLGWKSQKHWGEAFGHPGNQISNCIKKYWKTDKRPQGLRTLKILLDLERTVSEGITPRNFGKNVPGKYRYVLDSSR